MGQLPATERARDGVIRRPARLLTGAAEAGGLADSGNRAKRLAHDRSLALFFDTISGRRAMVTVVSVNTAAIRIE